MNLVNGEGCFSHMGMEMEAKPEEGPTTMKLLSCWLEDSFLGIVKNAYLCLLLNLKVGYGGCVGKAWEFSEKQFDLPSEGLALAGVWRSMAPYWSLPHMPCRRSLQPGFLKPAPLKDTPSESSCAEGCS